jgi:hypothetical protein
VNLNHIVAALKTSICDALIIKMPIELSPCHVPSPALLEAAHDTDRSITVVL